MNSYDYFANLPQSVFNHQPEGREAGKCPVRRLLLLVPVRPLDGRPVGTGLVTHITHPISVIVNQVHHKNLCFLVIQAPVHRLILGLPWLRLNNPVVSWTTMSIRSWSASSQSFLPQLTLVFDHGREPPCLTPAQNP